ncbi:MAG: twin-arginine translocase TatA/TatE family subunit [Nitrospiraceae bacterium]|nr:twin-arginine translocase TatA/TatE family subunit [Nitrospiraceae bacterium]
MYGIGTTELIIVFLIVLMLFGGSKLPGVGKALGGAISEFKASVKGPSKEEEDKTSDDEDETA